MVGQTEESQGVIKEGAVAPVTSSQSQVSKTTASLSGNVANSAIPCPLEARGKIEGNAVVPATPSPSQTLNATASLSIPSSQEILNLVASKYLNNLNPSTTEDFNGFIRYMKEAREVILVDRKLGSLIITVQCGSLRILEELWQDYCTGNLGRVVQECLVTEDILKELGLSQMKMITTIDEKDYRDCQEYLVRGRYDLYNTPKRHLYMLGYNRV